MIDNRPGAGTNIAMRALVDSAPDGYTLMLAANSLAANPSLYTPPPLDPARDITPISLVGRVPVVLAVGAGTSIDSLQAFIAAAKAKPRGITFGSPGNGSTPHLAIALFERRAGIRCSHIPYKGGAPAITDVLGGHIAAVAVDALEVQPHVKSGKLRVLAVMSPSRSGIFPDVPTVAESGFPGFEAAVWYVFIGPAGLPAPVVTRLHADIQRAMATEEVRSRLTTAGGEVLPGPGGARHDADRGGARALRETDPRRGHQAGLTRDPCRHGRARLAAPSQGPRDGNGPERRSGYAIGSTVASAAPKRGWHG